MTTEARSAEQLRQRGDDRRPLLGVWFPGATTSSPGLRRGQPERAVAAGSAGRGTSGRGRGPNRATWCSARPRGDQADPVRQEEAGYRLRSGCRSCWCARLARSPNGTAPATWPSDAGRLRREITRRDTEAFRHPTTGIRRQGVPVEYIAIGTGTDDSLETNPR
jgi:hypothetical protein